MVCLCSPTPGIRIGAILEHPIASIFKCGMIRKVSRYLNGFKAYRISPIAVTVFRATVSADLYTIGCQFRQTRKGKRITGGGYQVFFVVVETNIPSGLSGGSRPAQINTFSCQIAIRETIRCDTSDLFNADIVYGCRMLLTIIIIISPPKDNLVCTRHRNVDLNVFGLPIFHAP